MSKRILYVDSKDIHDKEDNCLVIHPSHLNMASTFDSSTFDKIFINFSKFIGDLF